MSVFAAGTLGLLAACDPCAGTLSCKNPPEVHAFGELIVHATGAPAAGVTIEFVRDSGPELVTNTIRTVSDSRGFFVLREAAYADGVIFGSLTVAPSPPRAPYTVPDFRLRTSRVRGDGNVLGRLVVDPYMLFVGEVRDYWTGVAIAGATVTARGISGASLSPNTFTVTTDENGFFQLQQQVVTIGRWTADFDVDAPGHPRRYVIRQSHEVQFRDGEFRYVLLLAGRKLLYVAQAVRRGTIDAVPGTTIEVARTGGIAVEPPSFTTGVNDAGGFAIQPKPLADGELVFTLTVRPPAPYPVQVYNGMRIQTHDDDSTRHIGFFGIGHWIPATVNLVDDTNGAPVPDASVAFVRTGGISVMQPASTRSTSAGIAQLPLGPTTAGDVTGNIVVTQAAGFRDTIISGVTLTAYDDDTLRSWGTIRLKRTP